MKMFLELSANAAKMRNGLRDGSRHVTDFVQRATQQFGVLGTAMTAVSTGLILKRLFSIRDFLPVDASLHMMQANLKATGEEMSEFRTRLASMAGSAGQDMTQLFASAKKLSFAYKADDITKIVSASSMAAKAMQENLDTVADRVSQIMKMYRLAPEEAKGVADALVASRLDMEKLDIILQRSALKGATKKDFTENLAVFAALKKSGFEAARTIMAVDAVLVNIEKKSSTLKRMGIDVFKTDPKTGEKTKKGITETLDDINRVIQKARKRMSEEKIGEGLDKLFGPGASEVIPLLISQADKIKKAKEDQANAAVIATERAAAAEQSWEHQLKKIKGHLDSIKTDFTWLYNLAKKPIQLFADSPTLTKGAAYGAAGLSLAALGGLAYGKIKNIFGSGKKNAGVGALADVQKVYVVNMPGSLRELPARTPGGKSPGTVAQTAKTTAGKVLPWLAGAATNPITAMIAGVASLAYMTWKHPELADLPEANVYGRDEWREEKLKEAFAGMPPPEVKNDIKLNVRIDKNDKVWAETSDRFTNIGINLERGAF